MGGEGREREGKWRARRPCGDGRVVFTPYLFGSYCLGQGERSKRNPVTTASRLISGTGIAGAAPIVCGCKEKPGRAEMCIRRAGKRYTESRRALAAAAVSHWLCSLLNPEPPSACPAWQLLSAESSAAERAVSCCRNRKPWAGHRAASCCEPTWQCAWC